MKNSRTGLRRSLLLAPVLVTVALLLSSCGTTGYGNLNKQQWVDVLVSPGLGVPIYAAVTASNCPNVGATLQGTNSELLWDGTKGINRLMGYGTGSGQYLSFRSLYNNGLCWFNYQLSV